MMLSLLVLAVPSMPGMPRSGLPTTMNADLKVAQALRRASGLSEATTSGPPPQYVTQDQDHFDNTNENTWNQAYYVNDTFWVPGSDAPVFVCVGGEGPALTGAAVVDSEHCSVASQWLSETKALMFAVEHRYYGCHNASACPVTSMKDGPNSGLKYLSSRQALADLSNFHRQAVTKYGLTDANKWVSFGGSYPGMLAGWFRLKFPQLIHASIASSAPVQAKVDMNEYNDIVASAYAVADNNVGGSPACHDAIKTGHENIGTMFTTPTGRATLAELFGQSPSWYESRDNQGRFAGNGVAYFPAQGNDPSCTRPGCNIGMICKVMTDTKLGNEVARLAKLTKGQSTWIAPKWSDEARRQEELEVADRAKSGLYANYWGYQTCTEFAFYQTCEVGSKCFFTQGYDTVNGSIAMCQEEFKVSKTKLYENVDETNSYYGGDKPAGSCVLYPNGEVDPWHGLSVLKSPSPGIPVLWVPGSSHHAWTHAVLPTDQASVVAARASIRAQVKAFLAMPCEQPEATAGP